MKTRKIGRRRQPAAIPKFWRAKTPAAVIRDTQIVHHDLVARFENGTATVADLWDWMETGFTYMTMVNLYVQDGVEFTDEAIAALRAQGDSYEAICARMQRTGRVDLTGPELLIARAAAGVMDELIAMDRHGIALRAAQVSSAQMDRILKKVGPR